MKDKKPKTPRQAPPSIRRNPPGHSQREKRQLPPELEALASGAIDRLPRAKRTPPPLKDPRGHALMPGVANKDVRHVFDARVLRMRETLQNAEPLLAELLCEAVLLGLWRGRSLTGFEAFVEDVIGLPADRARSLAQSGSEALQLPLAQLPDEQVAAWIRAEAALLEQSLMGRVSMVGQPNDPDPRLRIELYPGHAAQALAAIGKREAGLLRLIAFDALQPAAPGAAGGARRGARGPRRGPPPRRR